MLGAGRARGGGGAPVPGAGAERCELAARVVDTRCRCWAPMRGCLRRAPTPAPCLHHAHSQRPAPAPCLPARSAQHHADCAACVVEGRRCWALVLGAVSWLRSWWKQGAGAGRCWLRECMGAGAGCALGGVRVLGKLTNCGAVDFWSQRGGARALIPIRMP